jgi:hypothetical protein
MSSKRARKRKPLIEDLEGRNLQSVMPSSTALGTAQAGTTAVGANNLKQLGLACHNYESSAGGFWIM